MGSLTCLLGRTGDLWQTQHPCQHLVQSQKLCQASRFSCSQPLLSAAAALETVGASSGIAVSCHLECINAMPGGVVVKIEASVAAGGTCCPSGA